VATEPFQSLTIAVFDFLGKETPMQEVIASLKTDLAGSNNFCGSVTITSMIYVRIKTSVRSEVKRLMAIRITFYLLNAAQLH